MRKLKGGPRFSGTGITGAKLKLNARANPTGKLTGKQVGSQMLPSRHDMAEFTGGTTAQRSINNYAKKAGNMDLSGVKGIGLNLFTKGK